MMNWLVELLKCFVVVHGDTTVTLGHEGMLVASQTPFSMDDNGALVMPS